MTLPQKLKRLAAFDYDQAKMHAAIVKGCDAGNGNDGMSSDAELYAFGMEEQYRRMRPLIEALIACAEAAELFASFAPKGPVPEGLCPSFYHTLNYADEVKLQERIDAGREALTALEKLSGDGV